MGLPDTMEHFSMRMSAIDPQPQRGLRHTSSGVWVNNWLDDGVEFVKRRVQGQIEGDRAIVGTSSKGARNLKSSRNIIHGLCGRWGGRFGSAPWRGEHDGGRIPSMSCDLTRVRSTPIRGVSPFGLRSQIDVYLPFLIVDDRSVSDADAQPLGQRPTTVR